MFRDIQIPSLNCHEDLPLFTSLVVLVILLLLNRYWKKMSHTSLNDDGILQLPPGPWKLPLIENLHKLALAVGSLPHHFLTDLAKKYGPMMHLKLGQVSAIVISSPNLAKQAVKIFSYRPGLLALEIMSYNYSGIIASPCNGYWREMRKICGLELLSAKRVQSFSSLREEETWNLVQSITQLSQPINLSEMIFSTLNNITAHVALGKKCKHQQEFTSLVHETIRLSTGFGVPDLFHSIQFLHHATGTKSVLEKLHGKMDMILVDIINDHKQVLQSQRTAGEDHLQEDQDLVNVLLQLQESGELQFQLTTNHVKAVTLDMYFAGSETSAATIEWAMLELLRNPRAMDKAQAEIRQLVAGKRKIQEADIKKLNYLKLIIKETLRLHPPGPLIPRQANERCKVNRYDVPSEAKLLINVWAIGRDLKHWGPNADCFEPERFQGYSIDFRGTNYEFIPFGAGKRICPGLSFATIIVELALCQLLYFFNWKLPNGTKPQELDMTESVGMATRKRNDLNVIAIPFIL
ncbi:putative premnaspirodiene oxygenase [Rosa chinensis]|uniref:Putative premnaspirodiene oxygenase n=1 Tax=Rosa chinensis TaxID=74649 RepID=A0A2P6R511_ROSCH|nr:premnaspirodiene oxygenase isoform X1 [Rosa chinensis]PRQ41526.1 putative premnaspirodiene oxygenase [Rosa chinensis]